MIHAIVDALYGIALLLACINRIFLAARMDRLERQLETIAQDA